MKGVGFVPEDATCFIEDYTCDLTPGHELELASHMLEVPASFAATQPKTQVLPMAQIMYRHKPNFCIGTAGWRCAGGAHRSMVSTAPTREEVAVFVHLTGTERITIGDDTTEADLRKI